MQSQITQQMKFVVMVLMTIEGDGITDMATLITQPSVTLILLSSDSESVSTSNFTNFNDNRVKGNILIAVIKLMDLSNLI